MDFLLKRFNITCLRLLCVISFLCLFGGTKLHGQEESKWEKYLNQVLTSSSWGSHSFLLNPIAGPNHGQDNHLDKYDFWKSSQYFSQEELEWTNYTCGKFVNCIAEENNYIWVGTTGGLVKIDKFTGIPVFYDKGNSGLPTIRIYCIAVDSQGTKWIGTSSGLVRYDGIEWTVYNSSNSILPSNFIYTLAIDQPGIKWIGTYNGLVKFDDDNWSIYDENNSEIPDERIISIAIDSSGDKWIGTYGGLEKFDDLAWTLYDTSNSDISAESIHAIAIDNFGNKWISVWGEGIAKYDDVNWTVYNESNSDIPDDFIDELAVDKMNNLWLGKERSYIFRNQGVTKFDGINWTSYNTSNSDLPDNDIGDIFVDKSGNKWVGTYGGELAKFDDINWTLYKTSKSDLPNNSVTAIAIDLSGDKWIGTSGAGIAKFDDTNWIGYYAGNSDLPSNNVSSIVIDKLGNKWIGTHTTLFTFGSGLAKFDGTNWNVYNTSNSDLPDGNILSLAIDNIDNKWIGTGAGLASYDESVWTVYDTSQSDFPFSDGDVDIVTTDKSGNVWIGSYGKGIGKFDGTTWIAFNTSNSELPSNYIRSISIDSTGNKWIGTGSRGLVKYTDSTWTTYNTTNSDLPFNYVYSIAIDSSGNKWIGGSGLAVFNDRRWIYYNSGVFNTTVKTLAIDKTGIVWIGTSSDGLIAFNPGEVFPPNTPPQIISDAEATAYEDSLFIYTAKAVDSEDPEITYIFQDIPTWLSQKDSILSGTPKEGTPDTSFVVIALDGELSDTLMVTLRVTPINDPPELISPSAVTAYEDSLFEYTARALDPEKSDITYTFQNFPSWLTPKDSIISGKPLEGTSDTSFIVIASDEELSDTLLVELTVVLINDPPQITNIKDFTFTNSDIHKINLDSCVIDLDHSPESMIWVITPQGKNLKIDVIDNIATFIATNWSGEINVKFKVTDPEGASDSITVKCSVLMTGLDEFNKKIPKKFSLAQNYPNPFNPVTTIVFDLPQFSEVKIEVYNTSGQIIKTILNEKMSSGSHQIELHASNLASGIYYYRIEAGKFQDVKKMILIK